MKHTNLFKVLLMAIAISMGFSSCEKDDDYGIMVRMRNQGNGSTHVSIFDEGMHINSSNNFVFYYYYDGGGSNQIASVGKVSGLSKVKEIPSSGWTKKIAVEPRMGYVVRNNNRYARIWVKDWIEGTSGGIIGAIVYYEEDWR